MVSVLQENLENYIQQAFESLVDYKKDSKSFNDVKKLMEKNLDVDNIVKKIEFYKEQQKKLEKVKLPENQKLSLYTKYREQQKKYADLLKHAQQNNSNKWLVEVEAKFLKKKEYYREKKIKLLMVIKRLLLQLKNKLGLAKFKEYKKQLYLKKLTDDIFTYDVKTIMKHLESGPISEKAIKKSKQLNELKSIKNVKNRKTQIELEIELVKLKNVVEKFGIYKNKFIDKIKKIIDKRNDDMLKQRLFRVVTRNKRNNNFKVVTNSKGMPVQEQVIDIKPVEFNNFVISKNLPAVYQKEIDKYMLKLNKLNDKNKSIRMKIAKLKAA